MSDNLENFIRQWGQLADVEANAASQPHRAYAEAESMARNRMPSDARLVDDFREALAEGAPPFTEAGQTIRMPNWTKLAIAASIVLAVGVGMFLASSQISQSKHQTLLASASVGLQSQLESGMVARGPLSFATGEAIMFRIELARESNVMLINLDPMGRLIAVPPISSSRDLVGAISAGTTDLGPYRLDGTIGTETFFIIATVQSIDKIAVKRDGLIARHTKAIDIDQLLGEIESWPADVEVISFDHVGMRP